MASRSLAVVGLGYVGLPLALAFGRRHGTLGYDIDERRIAAFGEGRDPAGQADAAAFQAADRLSFSSDPADLSNRDFIIVTVPTPIDAAKRPDLSPLRHSTAAIARNMSAGTTVIFESTVYPGVTEEVCVPILEELSGLKWKTDFFVAYSPERINPGDTEHTLSKIIKVVAGDTPETRDRVQALYEEIIEAGIHPASSIQVAEAAKVIENTQRDINIALMNELSLIFHRLGIDTQEVLAAAGTKWNFLKFFPGLVGGHCIGVDPYYLTHKAEQLGYHPEVILAGRRINDSMGGHVAKETVRRLLQAGTDLRQASVNLLGLTFKPDISDVRNSKSADVFRELRDYGLTVNVCDPHAAAEDIEEMLGQSPVAWEDLPPAEALILAVPHKAIKEKGPEALAEKVQPKGLIIDVLGQFDLEPLEAKGHPTWRL